MYFAILKVSAPVKNIQKHCIQNPQEVNKKQPGQKNDS